MLTSLLSVFFVSNVSRIWAEKFPTPGIFFSSFFQNSLYAVRETFWGALFFWKSFCIYQKCFGNSSENFYFFVDNSKQVAKLCPEGHSEERMFLRRKFKKGILAKNIFNFFGQKFRRGCQNFILNIHRSNFRKNVRLQETKSSILQIFPYLERKPYPTLPYFFSIFSETYFMRSEEYFEMKCFHKKRSFCI